jgi:enediyne biosynthesis protein E4
VRCALARFLSRACTAVTAVAAPGAAFAQASFLEQAEQRGLAYTVTQGAFGGPWQYGCGLALADFDNDGDLDIVASGGDASSGVPSLALFANDGSGFFVDRTFSAGLGSPSKPSGLAAADFDGDGDLDLCVTRWLGPPILFRNEGNLQFVDITAAAGIVTPQLAAGGGAAWADYDGDGWLDLVIANRTNPGAPTKNRLFRNLGNGTFVDVANSAGVADGMASFQASWSDIDSDGDLDMYVANDKGSPGIGWNRLFINQGNGSFVEDLTSGASISIDAMGVCFADLNGDLVPEIFVANVPSGNVLLTRTVAGPFVNLATQAGVFGAATCWGGIGFDADQDGDTDLFFTTSSSGKNFYFERNGAWPLLDRSELAGLSSVGESYCHVAGDIDNDGDIDLLVQKRNENLRLFVNQVNLLPGRQWVKFEPLGLGADPSAIGLQITATYATGKAWRQVEAGSGYKSHSPATLHYGIGSAPDAGVVVARWPNGGGIRTLNGYPANRMWLLVPDARLGDADRDGILGHGDRSAFLAAIDAPFVSGSAWFDFDGDADVDADDERHFLARYCDLTGDRAVSADDLAMLLGRWGNRAAVPVEGDFDADGVVGMGDLMLLLEGWS